MDALAPPYPQGGLFSRDTCSVSSVSSVLMLRNGGLSHGGNWEILDSLWLLRLQCTTLERVVRLQPSPVSGFLSLLI